MTSPFIEKRYYSFAQVLITISKYSVRSDV